RGREGAERVERKGAGASEHARADPSPLALDRQLRLRELYLLAGEHARLLRQLAHQLTGGCLRGVTVEALLSGGHMSLLRVSARWMPASRRSKRPHRGSSPARACG